MSWFKVDDGFLTHPKVFGIKSGPLALWLRAGLWCAKELTDGVMSARAVKALDAKPAHIQELVERGLWEPCGDGFRIHNFLKYQPSRDQVLKTRNETLQRVRKHRNAVTNADVTPAPGPGPVPKISSEEEEKKLSALSLSETAPANDRARIRDDRFEKPPVGEAPPNTTRSEPAPIRPEARCWQLYQRALGTEHLMLPPNHHDALSALASAAKAEAGGLTHGEAFDRAAERILTAWMGEPYWREKDRTPFLRNLKERLEAGKYSQPKQKPLLKAVPVSLSDAELLAVESWEEHMLSLSDKQRRWRLVLEKERREDAERARASGGAS